MAAPNIVNITSIIGRTNVQSVTTSPTDIIVNSAASNTVVKINSLIAANINGTNPATITASVFRSGTEFRIANVISVPAAASLVLIDKTTQIYLEEGDSLRLTASANSFIQAVCSYEVIS